MHRSARRALFTASGRLAGKRQRRQRLRCPIRIDDLAKPALTFATYGSRSRAPGPFRIHTPLPLRLLAASELLAAVVVVVAPAVPCRIIIFLLSVSACARSIAFTRLPNAHRSRTTSSGAETCLHQNRTSIGDIGIFERANFFGSRRSSSSKL